jgi:serine/threonine protein phosphatase PrpC
MQICANRVVRRPHAASGDTRHLDNESEGELFDPEAEAESCEFSLHQLKYGSQEEPSVHQVDLGRDALGPACCATNVEQDLVPVPDAIVRELVRLEKSGRHGFYLAKESKGQTPSIDRLQTLHMSMSLFELEPTKSLLASSTKVPCRWLHKVTVAESIGFRSTMDDLVAACWDLTAHVPDSKVKSTNVALFGLFDGHDGDSCSRFLARHLAEHLAQCTTDPLDAEQLDRAWHALDTKFQLSENKGDPKSSVPTAKFEDSDDDSSRTVGPVGGSTATVVLVEPVLRSACLGQSAVQADVAANTFRVVAAQVGDSRAILIRTSAGTIAPEWVALTTDHKPQNAAESKRIMDAGGFVSKARVNGRLAMSRAFGDFQYKRNKKNPSDSRSFQVVATPTVAEFKAAVGDTLLLFCDGFVEDDVWGNADIVAMYVKLRSMGSLSARDIARHMTAHSILLNRSSDNHTMMVVDLVSSGDMSAIGTFDAKDSKAESKHNIVLKSTLPLEAPLGSAFISIPSPRSAFRKPTPKPQDVGNPSQPAKGHSSPQQEPVEIKAIPREDIKSTEHNAGQVALVTPGTAASTHPHARSSVAMTASQKRRRNARRNKKRRLLGQV